MVELSNITNAVGLDGEARLALEQLVEVYAKRQPTNRLLGQYYECKQPTPSIGIDNIPDTANVPTRCDWAAKAVNSVSERVRMSGFTFAGDYRDPALDRIERANGLSTGFNRHVASELVHGCMFATVQRDGDRVAVRTHTAEWYDMEAEGHGYKLPAAVTQVEACGTRSTRLSATRSASSWTGTPRASPARAASSPATARGGARRPPCSGPPSATGRAA